MRRTVVVLGVVVGVALGAGLVGRLLGGRTPAPASTTATGGGNLLFLSPPAFAQVGGKGFLHDEAGISIYVNTGQTIDLAKARAVYKVIEDQTTEYTIGTVELENYGEDWWPHVWIHKSGWIVVYYPKAEPTSRLMHWHGYKRDTVTTTTLREVLLVVARRVLGPDLAKVEADLRYYHWQYPDATRLLTVVDWTNTGSDTFQYTIPSGLSPYEVTGSHFGEVGSYYGRHWSATDIDGTRFLGGGEGTYILVGRVAEKHLTLREPHTVKLGHAGGWTGVALFFLYR